MEQDDTRIVYDDTRYFSRGRSGFRPEPTITEKRDFWWALIALAGVVALFWAIRAMMPVVHS